MRGCGGRLGLRSLRPQRDAGDGNEAVSDGRRHPRLAEPVMLRVHVRLDEVFPPVWRRIEVASDLGLDDLHEVLQVVFAWEDAHLHRFTTGPQLDPGRAFVAGFDLLEVWDDEDVGTPEWQVRLDELLAAPGERLHYQYDYGDNWWLTLELEDTDPDGVPTGRAECIEGAGAAPPEDCGGTPGYELLVGAVDPNHPDHRVRRVEFARMYGEEVDPATFGLQPFDPDRINDELARLGLDSRPATPSAVGSALTALLIRARTPETHLRLRAMAAAADRPVEIDQATATTMTHAYRWLLDRLGGDGVKLTAAGYLPPAHVRAAFEELDLADEWIGAGNREDLTVPVLELRESAQRLGLLRKYRGRLLPTARGRTLADDPVRLWHHVAARLPIGGGNESDAEWQAGVLLLGMMATGTTDDAETVIATCLSDLGWQQGDGHPIHRLTVGGLIRDDVHVLRRLGALTSEGAWPGYVTAGGARLARLALAPTP